MDPGRTPQKRHWMTEKDPGWTFQKHCFYLSVTSGPFSAFPKISEQLHVSDWELVTDNIYPHGPVPTWCGMIVSRYPTVPPSLKHSLLLVFGFVFIWKLTLKLLTKHLQNIQISTRMRPKSCIDYATLQMAYHDESPWRKAGQPSRVLQDDLYIQAWGNATSREPFDLLVSLQACLPSHSSTAALLGIYLFLQ